MADTKATALAALTGAGTADGDLFNLVDVSDTTLAASGTNKKITAAELALAVGAGGRLVLGEVSQPSAASAGSKLFASYPARNLPAFIAAGVRPIRTQPLMLGTSVLAAQWGSSSFGLIGANAPTNYGASLSSNAFASTNLRTQTKRTTSTSSTAASSLAGFRSANFEQIAWRGNAAGLGGFHFCFVFGFSVISSPFKWLCGIVEAGYFWSNANTVEPSASTVQMIGRVQFGQDTTDTTIQVMRNNGGAACSKWDTGLASPTTARMYEVNLYAAPNASTIEMSIEQLGSGIAPFRHTASGLQLPLAGSALSWQLGANNGSTGVAVAVDLASVMIDTEI